MNQKFKFKRDKYMSARGGTSAFYDIYCIRCRHWLLLYQKDGQGNLFRLYLDRIHAPENLASLYHSFGSSMKFIGLTCAHCNASIGVPMIYKSENRPAFRLVHGSIVKKKNDGITLPVLLVINKEEVSNEDSES